MTNQLEQKLYDQLPEVADAILGGAVATPTTRPPQRPPARLVAATAAVLLVAGVAFVLRNQGSTVVVASASESVAASGRTEALQLKLYFIASDAMDPTVPTMGKVELFERTDEVALARGDLGLVEPDTSAGVASLRRIVGLPGETVSIRGSSVFVNELLIAEPYVATNANIASAEEETTVLGPNEYLLLPDNRAFDGKLIVSADRIAWWAPGETTAIQPYPKAERSVVLESYRLCLETAGVDIGGLSTDPASIFEATVMRLDPDNQASAIECIRSHSRLEIE